MNEAKMIYVSVELPQILKAFISELNISSFHLHKNPLFQAADKLLKKCFRNSNDDDDAALSHQYLESNSISDLLDYCALKDFHKPEFACISSCGPSHAPEFTFECKLNSIRRTAKAGSKQLAKQLSAKAVLDIIKSVRL